MKHSISLAVLVPVFNEQYLVASSLSRLSVLGESPLLHRIKVIVVDDASRDESHAALEQVRKSLAEDNPHPKFEWLFLRHEKNQGKGAALRTALAHADTDLVVPHDADLEYHPEDLLKMLPLFLEEEADVVYGSRFLASEFRRVLFYRHALGNHLLTVLCDWVCDLNLSDMETCYKMVRTPLLKSISLEENDFRIEVETTIKLARRGARFFEVPIRYSGRTYEEGKKINWRDGILALMALFRHSLTHRLFSEDQFGGLFLHQLKRAPRFLRWMADAIRPYLGNSVLEIGAGMGNLTSLLCPRRLYWATDSNELYLDHLRQLARSRPYLRVAFTDVTKAETFPQYHDFDTVVCLNVIEHIEDDVAAFRNLRSALPDGGKAIVLVPHGPWLYGSFDRVLGHHRRYTRQQLIAAAEQAGFCVRKVIAFNRASAPGWWINSKLLRRKAPGTLQMALLNLLVPIFRLVDSWLPWPSLSLIAILGTPRGGHRA